MRPRKRISSASIATSPSQAGRARAGAYIDRIEAACLQLADFPERGRSRDDLRPGLRTIGFERRATIVFSVDEGIVMIGRNLDTLVGEPG